jgi:fused signal recognition particle receptor
MFDLLKKKISGFIEGITKKEEKQVKEEEKTKKIEIEKKKIEVTEEKIEKQEIKERKEEKTKESEEKKIEKEKPEENLKEREKEFKPSIGIKQKISSIFTNTVTLEDKNLQPVFNDFKMSLLESDVSFSTADFMIEDLKKELLNRKVDKNKISNEVKHEVVNTLEKIFKEGGGGKKFFSEIKSKPFIVLFVGTNGSGKTTTIAKIAWAAKNRSLSTVMVAADTFRKAAIEQLSEHGKKINIPVIKRDYGADPTSVAFDAVSYAKAKNLDLILIDTAGRQETNQNLIREMEKINRVIKPNLKIFVGESISGNALVEQIKKFNEAIKLDGVILTKTDFDVKGGVLLSIFHEVKIPIFFTTNGQQYEDLKDFNSNEMINSLISD